MVKTSQSSTTNLFGHLQVHHPLQYGNVAPPSSTRKRKCAASASLQRSVTDMMPYDRHSERHNSLVKAVARYLTCGMVPFYTVDKPSFQAMLKALDPRFRCPKRKEFSKTVIPAMYTNMKADLVSRMSTIRRFSCTMDGWTSLAGDPYLSLTSHFINSEWELETRCLSTMYTPYSHTADNLCEFVKEGLRE